MAAYGRNQKWTIDASQRARVSALFTQALGCVAVQPMEGWEIYKMDDSCGVGVQYVSGGTLTTAQYDVAPWLEFRVADVAATIDKLRALDIEKVAYPDPEHSYFRTPGGPIFRLSAL